MVSAYDELVAKLRNGFKPPKTPGRCRACAFHIKTQGHRDGCPEGKRGR